MSFPDYMLLNPRIADVMKMSKSLLTNGDPAHDWSHVERVTRLAYRIAITEPEAEIEIVLLASLLHEAKRGDEMVTGGGYAVEGAAFSTELLRNMGFDRILVEKVCDSILNHRYSANGDPAFIEGKILQDADRLDSIGAIAIARVFSYNRGKDKKLHDPKIGPKKKYDGTSETYINHFYEKILNINPMSFWTEEARRIARKRYTFTAEFVEQFVREWELEG